ncbi:MAG: MFS transporter [Acidobacteriota bacterium]|jgi:multidrug resistance protein
MKRSPLVIVFLTVFIDLLGFGIVLPLIPYYAEAYHASSRAIGLLMSSYSLMQFIFTPIWGRLSDRYGRRPPILISLAGSCIGFLIFGLARTLPMLFFGRMVAGIAGAIIPTANAYIADVTAPEERAKGMGMIGAAFGLGFILGPAIGGLLAPYGYDKPVLLASLMAALNLMFAFFRLPESLTPEARSRAQSRRFDLKTLKNALSHPRIAPLLAMYLIVIFAIANMEGTFGLLNEHRYRLSARDTGYLFALIGILMSVTQGLVVGRLARRLGERWLIVLGTFTMIFGLGLMPFTPNMPAYCFILAILSFGAGINNPSISALLSKSSGIDEQGGIMGIAQSMASLGRILGPAWGGYAFDVLGVPAPFITGGLFMGLAFLLSLVTLRNQA